MVLKLQNSMNNVEKNKKSEMFSENKVDMRVGKSVIQTNRYWNYETLS